MPKLEEDDRPDLLEMYDAIVKCLEGLPERLLENQKFGLLAINAMFNIIGTIVINTGAEKEEVIKGLEQVLDAKSVDKCGILN